MSQAERGRTFPSLQGFDLAGRLDALECFITEARPLIVERERRRDRPGIYRYSSSSQTEIDYVNSGI